MKQSLRLSLTLLNIRCTSLRLVKGNQTTKAIQKPLRITSEWWKDPICKIICNTTLKWF